MIEYYLTIGATLIPIIWLLKSSYERLLKKKFEKLPPGPPDHFLLGNILQFKGGNHYFFDELAQLCKVYGEKGMMRFRLPFEDPKFVIYKPLVLAEFFDRFGDKLIERLLTSKMLSLEESTGYCKDILMGSGEYWKVARKTFVKGVLANLGRSVPIIEKRLKEAIDSIRKFSNQPFEIGEVVTYQSFGVIADMSTGRVPLKEETVRELLSIFRKMNPFFEVTAMRNVIPGYRYIPWNDEFRTLIKRRNAILQSVIDEHKKTIDYENPVDFLDSLLVDFVKENSSIDVLQLVLDTFAGGTETSSNTIEILIGYMVNYPEIQKKVHDEIDSVINDRVPNQDDESKLPYLNAVLREVMRIVMIAGVLVRETVEDISFQNYFLPKGTAIFAFIHGMANDPEIWKDPHIFRPERFLEEEQDVTLRAGEMPKNRDFLKFTPFGLGKRACPGYQLAKKELFFQAMYYLWAFEFTPKDSQSKVDLTLQAGLVTRPKTAVQVRAKFRHAKDFEF
jgi:cytochrome P450